MLSSGKTNPITLVYTMITCRAVEIYQGMIIKGLEGRH